MKRILVVDDDLLICGAIRAWLEPRGFAVVVANGGATGLNALECAIFDFNAACRKLFGYRIDEVVGQIISIM
jgi:CheY-like chemotaxis protein